MRFARFHITNYRNIHDSGPIDVDQITAFVGVVARPGANR